MTLSNTKAQNKQRKGKHVPMRRCVVCRESKARAELIRFYKDDTAWKLDKSSKAGGRGTWVCQEAKCHNVKKLQRFFRADASFILEQVKGQLEEGRKDMMTLTETITNKTATPQTESNAPRKRVRVSKGGMNV